MDKNMDLDTKLNLQLNTDDKDQLQKDVEKIKEYVQYLRGKAIMLQDKEEQHIEQQSKILRHRRTIMHAIREFAIEYGSSREESISVINRFEKILDDIDIDLNREEDEIMG